MEHKSQAAKCDGAESGRVTRVTVVPWRDSAEEACRQGQGTGKAEKCRQWDFFQKLHVS